MAKKKPWQVAGLPAPKSEASKGPLSLVDYEIYSGIEIPVKPLFVRLDGWRFHHIAESLKLKKPYDKFLARCLLSAAKPIFKFFDPILAYIFSDEINFLFLKQPGWRRIEKIDSVLASLYSSAFAAELKKKYKKVADIAFDCRAIPMPKNKILPYLIWRQAEAFRNHNNSWAYWLLRQKERLSPRVANKRLTGLKVVDLKELCLKYKVDLNKTPAWQRKGILLYKEPYKKSAWDPIKKKKVSVIRHRIKETWDPVTFNTAEGKKFLEILLEGR